MHMITIEKLSQGLADYIINELAPKTTGLKTWAMYMIAMTVSEKSLTLIGSNIDIIKSLGYMNEDGSIDDSKVFRDLKRMAHEAGSVRQNIPMVGDFTFDENDIDILRRYIQ